MCGFGGIINSRKLISRQRLKTIADRVSFRGPDSCGIRILNTDLQRTEEGVHALFFNRLAIMDLDPRSDQPFEDDRYLLTFNGEIYNYPEIKRALEKKGISFNTTSDTEVLFHALKEWGVRALDKLNGMFAFFWLDKIEKRFLIARDRLGIKPLYYQQKNDTFIFGSELRSIIRLADDNVSISSAAVDMYLWMQFVPTPFSIIEGIHKLPPGCYISGVIDKPESILLKEFWNAYNFATSTHQPEVMDLETVLKNSLQRQLHADVPLGLFLSSGVDSSLLAALVNKYFAKEKPVNFFTVQFEENTSSDESREAEEFIREFNNPLLNCHTITVNPATIQKRIDELYNYYDEPFADPASLLNWAISEKARESVTVAISGDGADELFWGYNRYNRWKTFTRLNDIPVLSNMARIAGKLPSSTFSNNIRFVLEKDPVKRHFNFFLPSGMRPKIRNHITNYPLWALDNVDSIKKRKDLPAILDIKTYLADAMLYKVDRSSMAASLEIRVPYLDNEVLEYALKLPLSDKSNQSFHNKAPLKKLLSRLAPHYPIDRAKKGFSFPLEKWLKGHWKEQVMDMVTQKDLEKAGLNPQPYLNLINDFYASRNNYFTDVWYIFNLILWMKKIRDDK